ncbi:MAG: cation:proton antiporter [Gammaproteobacteria bacterium]|nr:cation:proton antiporter [Gammaproteobacteria bacterium]
MDEHAVLTIAGIGALAIACQWFAWWVKLPAILFLLLAGILTGPVLGLLHPDALFGELLFPFVSLSVAIILFEGSLTLKFSEIAGLEQIVRRMVTSGLVVTWAVVALAAYLLLPFPPELALLFGAFIVVTGPTVIVPLLRTVRPTAHVANILRWEGIVIDPIGALLAVLVFEFIISGQGGAAFGHTLVSFARIVGVGVLFGVLSGQFMGLALRNHWLPEFLHNVAALALVFAVFALSNAVEAEAGLLTVTVMGIRLANMRDVSVEHILDFKESLSVALISTLFIILAARIDFAQLQALGWGALGILAVIQFLGRPLKIALATYGSSLRWQERALLAWIGPRGIVAAAVAALFSMKLQAAGYPEAELLVPLTFLVIIGTVVLQSATARLLARALGVAEPEPRGFLIVGANPVARVIAEALLKRGYESVLCDTTWANVSAARMHGLTTFYGSAVSEYADRRLDLIGLGRLLALSPQQELNVLAVHRYRREFGASQLFALRAGEAAMDSKLATPLPAGYVAFGDDVSYERLANALGMGAEIRETALTENFDFDAYYRRYYKKAIPLFTIDTRERLHILTAGHKVKPAPGWTLLSLVEPEEVEQQEPEGGTRPVNGDKSA